MGKIHSAAQDNVVHYESCRVFIPQSHKIGSIGPPWWKRLLTMTDDRLKLLAIDRLQQIVGTALPRSSPQSMRMSAAH